MLQTILNKLLSARRVLIMTHRRPDGDAVGSSFGMRNFLLAHGVEAEVLLPDAMPNRFTSLCDCFLTTLPAAEAAKFDCFLALDCANAERLGCGEELSIELLRQKNFISIDHHRGNSIDAPCQWVDPNASSASYMAAELLLASGKEFGPEVATMLMTGIMTDTGSFCFSNTDAASFRTAAALMEHGADVERIANAIFFSKPLKQLRFEAALVENCFKSCCGGRFVYAFVPEDLMKKYDFDMREDEGLIDLLRAVDSAVIAMLCHRRADGFRVSLRSKDRNFPVGPIARELGGGGHDMAAGTTVDLPDFEEVENLMVKKISALLG